MKKWLEENRKNIGIMLIYLICSFTILIFHESWRDEAQAWLIARDLDLIGIINQMKYEGHFMLWYLILIPFAKLGFPYFTIKIVSWIIMSIAAWLILKKAPFNYITKILLIFSSPFIYWYIAVPRSYCIIPLAIILIAINHKNRNEKPLRYIMSIVLLANTHIIMYGLVGVLLLDFLIEGIKNRNKITKQQNSKIIVSFGVGIILLIITIFPLIGSLNTNSIVKTQISIRSFEIEKVIDLINLTMYLCTFKTVLPIILILLCSIYEFKYYTKDIIMIIASVLFQFIIYTFIYSTSEQRALTIIFIILLFIWIQKEKEEKGQVYERKAITLFISLLLIFNIMTGITYYIVEIMSSFSESKQVANYIEKEVEPNSIFICTDMPICSSVIPYLKDMKFWSLQSQEYFTYVTWNDLLYENYDFEQFESIIKEKFKGMDNIYYLFSKESDMMLQEELDNASGFSKIYESNGEKPEERYIIYKIDIDKLS